MRRLSFHLAVVAHHTFCYYFFSTVDFTSVKHDETITSMNDVRGSFLTGWNFTIQGLFFFFSLVEDVMRVNKTVKHPFSPSVHKTLQDLTHALFTTIVFPLSCFVSLVFWVFFTYNRELIYPEALDKALPLWFNHSLHTSIIVAAILEMCLVYHPYPRRKWGVACIVAFTLCYLVCVLLTYFRTGVWVYPMLYYMSWPLRFVWFHSCGLFLYGLYELGQWVSPVIWGDKVRRTAANGVKKSS